LSQQSESNTELDARANSGDGGCGDGLTVVFRSVWTERSGSLPVGVSSSGTERADDPVRASEELWLTD
jgi:hypothetical protein